MTNNKAYMHGNRKKKIISHHMIKCCNQTESVEQKLLAISLFAGLEKKYNIDIYIYIDAHTTAINEQQ